MLKVLLSCAIALAVGFANAGANDPIFTKRTASDTGQISAVYPAPTSDGFLTYSPVVHDLRWTTIGANLGITSGVLSASFSQVNADWNAASGASFIINKPTIGSAAARDVAPSGDAGGVQVVTGSDTRLTNARHPTVHLHNAVDIGDSTSIGRSLLTASTAANARTAIGAGTSSFDGTYASLTGKPASQTIQRIRAQTNTSGVYTWTFPTGYTAGTLPIIGVTVEDGSTSFWNHQVKDLTNNSVTVQLTKTSAVTVLGISVLGIAASPQAYIHLTAIAP